MARAKLSKAVSGILEQIVEASGDVQYTDEQAEAIWGGTGARVKELTQTQLLQLALVDAHRVVAELLEQKSVMLRIIESREPKNREERRKQGKLHLPR